MAVSDRKASYFKQSLSMASTEDFDICCDPCLSDGCNVEAKGFCVNCKENFCKSCLDVHRRLQISKDHTVEDQVRSKVPAASVQRYPQSTCTEVCTIHSKEVIKYFCRNHETLGCCDCVTLDHRNCDIKYITDVCAGVTKSIEFKEILTDLTEKLEQSDDFRKDVNTRMSCNTENITDTISRVEEFQKRMNEKLNNLKNMMIQELQKAKSAFSQLVDEALTRNDEVSSELQSYKANLETYLTSEDDAQAFTAMKRVRSRLRTLDIEPFKDRLLVETKTYTFEADEALEDILSTPEGLGKIVKSSAHAMISLSHEKDIHIKTKSDKSECNIISCALFSPGQLMLTDGCNNNVKIVDVQKQSIVEVYTLPKHPSDVAVLPHDLLAVTFPKNETIRIFRIREKFLTLRKINVGRMCCGITCYQNLLYCVCQHPNSVVVLSMEGTVQRDIPLKSAFNETIRDPWHITVSKDLQQIYISDGRSDMVVSLTLQGCVSAVYKNEELKYPWEITMMQDDSLLVCCVANGTIHHISADLTQGRKIAEGVTNAKCMWYDSESNKAYVGSYNYDVIRVFSLNCKLKSH